MKRVGQVLLIAVFITFLATVTFGQRLDGTLRGAVLDPSEAVVPNATVKATNQETGVAVSTQTSTAGIYIFPNLLVGTYTVEITATGFAIYKRANISVVSNQVTEANARIQLGTANTVVEVSGGAELVQTTSSQLAATFDAGQVDLPVGQLNGSVLALAALAPGTTLQGGGVLGEGGSVGGTRPRMNGFSIDGVDNNDVGVTGPQIDVIQDAVQEFQLVTNQFAAEYGHSAGGQFNVITKSGTNYWHGEGHAYSVNRDFLAMDNLEKQSGFTQPRRFDRNRAGASTGGPIVKDKVFIFGAYEYNNQGQEATSVSVIAPTQAGLSALNSLAANQSVRDVLTHFPVASNENPGLAQTVNGTNIPMGEFQAAAPDFFNQHQIQTNGDINAFPGHSIRLRYIYDRFRSPNQNPDLPVAAFTGDVFNNNHKAIFTETWTINNSMINDFRASYSRNTNGFGVPAQFANFPNVIIDNLSLNIGPEGNSPQSGAQNTYQISNQISYARGAHTFKWGVEWRKYIAASDFLPRSRGEFDYGTLQTFVNDLVPDGFNGALRGAGSGFFAGNQNALYWFAQDDWKVSRKLTLNLGVRYEWNGNPRDAQLQSLNSIASLPSVFDFRVPKDDKNNFSPHIGFAYDIFGDSKWAVRGGFSLAYDVTFQNLIQLQLPPQLQSEQNPNLTCSGASGTPPAWCATGTDFLAGGGLLQTNVPPTNQADARSATQALIVDTKAPEVYTWSLGVQHELWRTGKVEVRYLGTHSLFLPVQTRLNAISIFENGFQGLPTFASASDVPASFSDTAPTRADAQNLQDLRFSAQGFDGGFVTAFAPIGSGIYHSGSVDYTQRTWKGLSLRANYTYAHNIDDSTNELFSSLVNPRRPEDFSNIAGDRGRSVLDIRGKFALSWVYEPPKFTFTQHRFLKNLVNGWLYSATFVAQTGQPVTPLSGADRNGNLDAAGDRAFFNPVGVPDTGTGVSFVCRDVSTGASSISADGCGGNAGVVGYVANDPNAQFVVSELGALPGDGLALSGRNQISTPGMNLWNMSVSKRVPFWGESRSIEFQVNAFNVFNHRNFTLVNPDVFQNNNNALSNSFANVNSPDFLNAKQFNGGKRTLQFGLKILL
jgi:hypothetical protein